MESKNIFNKPELAGQVVNNGRNEGVITALNDRGTYPVAVEFRGRDRGRGGEIGVYTECGRCHEYDTKPSLKFGKLSKERFDYGKPAPIYKPLEFKQATWRFCRECSG